VKTNSTKRRYKAQKKSACGLCKPHQRGGEDKKTVRDRRIALKHESEMQQAAQQSSALSRTVIAP
jgi:hypothetical protein